MNILQQIKAGNCYIRTEDNRDLALVINYCHDNDIDWGCFRVNAVKALNIYTRDIIAIYFFRHALFFVSPKVSHALTDSIDITDQFFKETA